MDRDGEDQTLAFSVLPDTVSLASTHYSRRRYQGKSYEEGYRLVGYPRSAPPILITARCLLPHAVGVDVKIAARAIAAHRLPAGHRRRRPAGSRESRTERPHSGPRATSPKANLSGYDAIRSWHARLRRASRVEGRQQTPARLRLGRRRPHRAIHCRIVAGVSTRITGLIRSHWAIIRRRWWMKAPSALPEAGKPRAHLAQFDYGD